MIRLEATLILGHESYISAAIGWMRWIPKAVFRFKPHDKVLRRYDADEQRLTAIHGERFEFECSFCWLIIGFSAVLYGPVRKIT